MHSTHALVVSLFLASCAASSSVATSPEPSSEPTPPATASASAAASPVTSSSAAPPPVASAEAPVVDKPAPGSPGEMLMRDHFKQTVTLRQAVIWGDISSAVVPAESLAGLEGVKTLPRHWQVSATQLQDSARRIRQSSDLSEAAAATADIGRACGLCHAAVRGPKIVVDAPPAMDSTVSSRMRRHQWATERLWEGLYVPSDQAWAAGAGTLDMEPFPAEALKKGGVHARSAASRFTATAKTLAQAKTSEARGVVYADLLSTCGPCHEAMGVKR